jgi:hypothetical protein
MIATRTRITGFSPNECSRCAPQLEQRQPPGTHTDDSADMRTQLPADVGHGCPPGAVWEPAPHQLIWWLCVVVGAGVVVAISVMCWRAWWL